MNTNKRITGLMLATAAAGLFAMAPVTMAGEGTDSGVHCVGANACKGTSECKTADNACKGQNACKGHGWIKTKDAEECTAKGGKVEEPKS